MNTLNHPISRLVSQIAKAMCCEPEKCSVAEEFHNGKLTIGIEPSAQDYGPICGREGKFINALSGVVARAGTECETETHLVLRQSADRGAVQGMPENANGTSAEDIERLICNAASLVNAKSTLRIERNNGSLEVFVSNGDGLTTARLHDVFYAVGRRNGQRVKIRVA